MFFYDDDSCDQCGGIDGHYAGCPYLNCVDDDDEDGGWVTHRADDNSLWETDEPSPAASPEKAKTDSAGGPHTEDRAE